MDHEALMLALNNLTTEQLKEVRARASVLLGEGVDAPTGHVLPGERELHELICIELERHDKSAVKQPYTRLTSAKHYDTFTKGASIFLAFIGDKVPGKILKNERRAVIRSLIRVLLTDMRTNGVKISHRSVSGRLAEIEVAVERQFPGYIASGMLPLVIRMTQGRRRRRLRPKDDTE